MPKLPSNHIHEWERWKKTDKKNIIYRCVHPTCTSTMDKTLLLGKQAQCGCGRDFILTAEDLRRFKPRCAFCGNRKQQKEALSIASILDAAGITNVQLPEEDRLK